MMGGLRHFVWDLGKGYSADQRMALARFTLFASLPLTVLIWIAAYAVR
jgi:succinate dehydrogenase / fumarate reductase cytochrome b subunit